MKTCSIVNKCIIDNKEMLIKMTKHWIFVTKMMVNKVAFIARFQIDKNHLTPGKLRQQMSDRMRRGREQGH